MNYRYLKTWKWVLAIIALGLFLKALSIYKYSIPFTYDQGRDLLDLREMWLLRKPRLIGPTTSLHGIFCGPFWYWLIFPFYLISKGSPYSPLAPLWLVSVLMPVLIWVSLKDKKNGLVFVVGMTLSFPFLTATNHALNSHPMIYLYPLILTFLTKYLTSRNNRYLFWSLFLLSAGFHFNFVVASFLLVAVTVIYLLDIPGRKSRPEKISFLGFVIPFIPQLVFEIRHDFLQIRTLSKLFQGDTGSLSLGEGGSSRWTERFSNIRAILQIDKGSDSAFWTFIFLGLALMTMFLVLKKRRHASDEATELFYVSLVANAVMLACVLAAPFAIWSWYISSIQSGLVFFFTTTVYWLLKNHKAHSGVIKLVFAAWAIWNCLRINLYPLKPVIPTDPSNLKLRLNIIRQIYQNNQGRGMRIFTFAPNVYDYPYQYLIWYEANKRYGYLPEQYCYLPDVPEYIPAKEAADSLIINKDSHTSYLIIEPYESQEEWFNVWRAKFDKPRITFQIGKTKVEILDNSE